MKIFDKLFNKKPKLTDDEQLEQDVMNWANSHGSDGYIPEHLVGKTDYRTYFNIPTRKQLEYMRAVSSQWQNG